MKMLVQVSEIKMPILANKIVLFCFVCFFFFFFSDLHTFCFLFDVLMVPFFVPQ